MSTTYTPNYNLGKQEDHTDKFDMSVITENMDKLDTALHEQAEDISEAQNRQDSLDTAEAADRAALAELIDGGAKNVIQVGYGSGTPRTISVTQNADGSLTLNGTSSSSSNTILINDLSSVTNGSFDGQKNPFPQNGKYILRGTKQSNIRVQLIGYNNSSDYSVLSQSSDDQEVEIDGTWLYYTFRVWITGSASFDNYTLYPMCCSKAAWDISQAYQPYRPSYAELYEMVKALQGGSNSISSVQSTAQLTELDKTEELTTIDDSGYTTENS